LPKLFDVGVRRFTGADDRRRFSEFTIAATDAFIADREQSDAAFAWFRGSPREVEQHRNGLTPDTHGMLPSMLIVDEPSALQWPRADRAWQRMHPMSTGSGAMELG
jgi:hypothetical protein